MSRSSAIAVFTLLFSVARAAPAWAQSAQPGDAQHADRKFNLCTITLDSPVDTHALVSALPAGDFDQIELVPRTAAKSEGKDAGGQAYSWFSDACEQAKSCDALVISGHFSGGFFGRSGRELSLEELQRQYCQVDGCAGVFARTAEVLVIDRDAAAFKGFADKAKADTLQILLDRGIEPGEAAERAEARHMGLQDGLRSLSELFGKRAQVRDLSSFPTDPQEFKAALARAFPNGLAARISSTLISRQLTSFVSAKDEGPRCGDAPAALPGSEQAVGAVCPLFYGKNPVSSREQIARNILKSGRSPLERAIADSFLKSASPAENATSSDNPCAGAPASELGASSCPAGFGLVGPPGGAGTCCYPAKIRDFKRLADPEFSAGTVRTPEDKELLARMNANLDYTEVRNSCPDNRSLKGDLQLGHSNLERGQEAEQLAKAFSDCAEWFKEYLNPVKARKLTPEKYAALGQEACGFLPDVIGLDEVDRGTCRDGYRDMARYLAMKRGCMNYAFFPEWVEVDPVNLDPQKTPSPFCKGRAPQPELTRNLQGNAILSRFPITHAEGHRFPDGVQCHDWFKGELGEHSASQSILSDLPAEKGKLQDAFDLTPELRRGGRSFIEAEISVPDGKGGTRPFVVIETHLEDKSRPECRNKQEKYLRQWIAEKFGANPRIPIVLTGDWNTGNFDGSEKGIGNGLYNHFVRPFTSVNGITDTGLSLIPGVGSYIADGKKAGEYVATMSNPTLPNIPGAFSNPQGILFSDLRKSGFHYGDLNEKMSTGYVPTHTLDSSYGVGPFNPTRSKLDWIAGNGCVHGSNATTYKDEQDFDLAQYSDHRLISADLKLDCASPETEPEPAAPTADGERQ